MCATCEAVKDLNQKQALDIIADAVARNGTTRHLSELMDRVLDTQVEERVDAGAERKAFKTMQHLQKEFAPSKAKEDALRAMGKGATNEE